MVADTLSLHSMLDLDGDGGLFRVIRMPVGCVERAQASGASSLRARVGYIRRQACGRHRRRLAADTPYVCTSLTHPYFNPACRHAHSHSYPLTGDSSTDHADFDRRLSMTRLFAGTPYTTVRPRASACGNPESACTCPPILLPTPARSSDKKIVRLSVEKRKKGKVVTVIRGLSASANDLPALLAQLKNQCGAGGTLDGDTLELQGNHLPTGSALCWVRWGTLSDSRNTTFSKPQRTRRARAQAFGRNQRRSVPPDHTAPVPPVWTLMGVQDSI